MARSKKIYKARQERYEVMGLLSTPTKTWTYFCLYHGEFKKQWDTSKALCPTCGKASEQIER